MICPVVIPPLLKSNSSELVEMVRKWLGNGYVWLDLDISHLGIGKETIYSRHDKKPLSLLSMVTRRVGGPPPFFRPSPWPFTLIVIKQLDINYIIRLFNLNHEGSL